MKILEAEASRKPQTRSMEYCKRIFPTANGSLPGYAPYTAIWYVDSTNGADTLQGDSPASAFKTLTTAVARATAFGRPHQCIILEPGTYNSSETFPIVIGADLDYLTIMSRADVSGIARHTVIGATNAGGTSGLIYCWADGLKLLNLTFLSNNPCVFVGTETTHPTSTNTVVTGCELNGCVFDIGTTASKTALNLSCTAALVDGCELVAGSATATICIAAYDPFTIKNSTLYSANVGIQTASGGKVVVQNCEFMVYNAVAAPASYYIDAASGASYVVVRGCRFGPDSAGDGTETVAASATCTDNVDIVDNVYVTAIADPSAGAGDKTCTTTALTKVKSY